MHLIFAALSVFANTVMAADSASGLSTHVLDISQGKPGAGCNVETFRLDDKEWTLVGRSKTDENGRIASALVLDAEEVQLKNDTTYKLRFDTAEYYERDGIDCFYPHVEVMFRIADATRHFHVPITLAPYGYSTYKGQ
ncbi:unnamed protein product, partial [Mesorhabditis spiculigera]